MKKMLFTLAAVFTFSIAGAQTDTKTTQPVQPQPPKAMEDKDKAKQDAEIQNDVNRLNNGEEAVPRKDEIKTRDHVKSTPEPRTAHDTVATKKKVKRTKKRS